MLIILPPSETKRRTADGGPPVALGALSFPELTSTRRRVIKALIETSRGPDALERLRVRPTLVGEVAANEDVLRAPAVPPLELYAGPLFVAFDGATLSAAAARRADEQVVITSALWGVVCPRDRIPAYRLHVCSHLIGLADIEPEWRKVVPQVLAYAAGEFGAILDLRSPTYQAIGMPADLGERTATLRVLADGSARSIGDVDAKRIRGRVARHLLESGAEPADPTDLVEILGERWPVRLQPPASRKAPWTILLRPAD